MSTGKGRKLQGKRARQLCDSQPGVPPALHHKLHKLGKQELGTQMSIKHPGRGRPPASSTELTVSADT